MSRRSSSSSALILAGGKATRLGGAAKHELLVDGGHTIFERQVAVLAPRVAEILVATPHDIAGYRCVRDVLPDVGPLAGIAAGLAAVRTPWLVVIAGDMPHMTGEVIDELLAAAAEDAAEDAVGVRIRGLAEPLVCALHHRVLAGIERRIESRRYKVADMFADMRVTWLDLDRHMQAFSNVNEPADLAGITGSKPA